MTNLTFDWQISDFMIYFCSRQLGPRTLSSYEQASIILTDEEFRRLVAQLDKSYFSEHRDFAMIHLMPDSGVRPGECTCILPDL